MGEGYLWYLVSVQSSFSKSYIKIVTMYCSSIIVFIISNADGKVEASDDAKGKANDVDKAKETKTDSKDDDKPSPPGRSTISGDYYGHPHVLERYSRGLTRRAHLRNLRKVKFYDLNSFF